MTKGAWVFSHAVAVASMSLVAAVSSENPNWYWNIPLGLISGAAFGLINWAAFRAIAERTKP